MEGQRFIEPVTQAEIAASGKLELDLNDLRSRFGNNFNTLQITNTHASNNISIYADGVKIAFVTANNGVFAFDWEMGLIFNMISIENESGSSVIEASSVKTFVGRTGAS